MLAGAWIVHVHDWCIWVGGVGAPAVHDWLVAIVCVMRNDGFRLREWEESDAAVLLAAYAGTGMETERPADVTTVFVVEGRERQKLVYDGVRYDTETHARLATDPA